MLGSVDALPDCSAQDCVQLIQRFQKVREQTEVLAAPLSEADSQLQSMPDASPAKWHLAHTTWFFETFILRLADSSYRIYNPSYNYLFNSYYNGIGEQYPRHQRGLISRPSLAEIIKYRHHVTQAILDFFEKNPSSKDLALIELGIQHEQQHQELLLTDIKHAFFQNPTYPAYISASIHQQKAKHNLALSWCRCDGGLTVVGHDGEGFSFDNERPAHQVYLYPFAIASRLVNNGEYLDFILDGGYQRSEYWLADAWAWLEQKRAQGQTTGKQPLYWLERDGEWFEFTLHGLQKLDREKPLLHISYYEASAYAAWLGQRLPKEFEWEAAMRHYGIQSADSTITYQPTVDTENVLSDAFACAWQWTTSHYGAYPGFQAFDGLAGEYNGKFMSNQMVLRGSSCVTPEGHARLSYRNFFYAPQAWQFTGIRLAQSL